MNCEQVEAVSLAITRLSEIQDRALENYLAACGISLKAAKLHMKEVKVYNRKSRKHFFTLGMKNEEDGYELRSQYFKGCVGKRDITIIRGGVSSSRGLHVFKSSFDFETVLTLNEGNPLKDDAYILHAVSSLTKLIPYLKEYGYKFAYTWMDNDKVGTKATCDLAKIFKAEDHQLLHKPMNRLYRSHKGLNAWHKFLHRAVAHT
jgi:hypothetical protein